MYLVIVVAVIIFLIYALQKDARQRWFAWCMNKMGSMLQMTKYKEMKKEFLHPISSIKSQFPELASQKALKILEVGVGTGANFEYYPDGTKLVVVDPNPHFKTYYDANRSKYANIKSEEIIVAPGEDMDMVDSNSVDVVVMTLVMCSADYEKIPKLLQQINRVLVPGGKFFFWEHIKEFDPSHSVRSFMHEFLTKIGVWGLVFDNCCLNRDPLKMIEKAGFSEVDFERKHAPAENWVFWMIQPHLIGTATK